MSFRSFVVCTCAALYATAAAEPIQVPMYTINSKTYFDVFWIAQLKKASIGLDYQGTTKINFFAIDGTTYRFPNNSSTIGVDNQVVTLSEPVRSMDSYPLLSTQDFKTVFPTLEPEWFDAAGPTAVRTTVNPQKSQTTKNGWVYFNVSSWWNSFADETNIIQRPCPDWGKKLLGTYTLYGCGTPTTSLGDIKAHLMKHPDVQKIEAKADNENAYSVLFTGPNGLKYRFMVTTGSEGRLWVLLGL